MQQQGSGPHTGKQGLKEGRRGLGEEQEGCREMQVGLAELQECASPGESEEAWEILWCLGGEVGRRARGGVRGQGVGERPGLGRLSLPAQRGRTCRGGGTKHQQAARTLEAQEEEMRKALGGRASGKTNHNGKCL